MTVQDFIEKEYHLAREQGALAAARSAAGEIGMKAMSPYADWKARPIWAGDWDVCLVLDATRWDLWREVVGVHNAMVKTYEEWPGSPALASNSEVAWSVGSASPEWISNTFGEYYSAYWRRAGYVTANPFSAKDGTSCEYCDDRVYPLADRGLGYLDEVWRDQWHVDELETVRPDVMTSRGLYAYARMDELGLDRLVVHYMQPHVPFKKRPEWTDGWDLEDFGTAGSGKDDWHKVRDGELPEDEFWNAYAANLEWVLREIRPWFERTDARILVTSDHGNAMGEWGQWSHPPGSANPALRRVPWVPVEGHGGGELSIDPPGEPPVVGEVDGLEERLQALGYR